MSISNTNGTTEIILRVPTDKLSRLGDVTIREKNGIIYAMVVIKRPGEQWDDVYLLKKELKGYRCVKIYEREFHVNFKQQIIETILKDIDSS